MPAENSVKDCFCGAGGSSTGAEMGGGEVVFALNHSALAINVHNTNHPKTDHLLVDVQSMTDGQIRRTPDSAILIAGAECFPAGTLVLLSRGLVPIEEVRVGDTALTHNGRWRRVCRVQSRVADTVIVKGQGHTPGIEVTANHRFYLRASRPVWNNEIRKYRRQFDEPGWMPVNDAIPAQALWSTPTEALGPGAPWEHPPAGFGDDPHVAWWLVGRWLGDGSLELRRRKNVVLTCGFHEATELGAVLSVTGESWRYRESRTAGLFELPCEELWRWLSEHFGHGAAGKGVPGWALMLQRGYRRSLLDGYVSADGSVGKRRVQVDTVSKRLAIGMRLIAEGLGHRVGLYRYEQRAHVIEGREVNAQPIWKIAWEAHQTEREAFDDGTHSWSRVREISPGRDDVEVFNLEVEEDHSYVADGIVVKNCTNHTLARGARSRKQQSEPLFDENGVPTDSANGAPLADGVEERSRATMDEVCRFVEQKALKGRPYLAVVLENVSEAHSWGQDNDGRYFKKWLNRILKVGYDHEILWLNSMLLPPEPGIPLVPQSRDRMYVVFWRRGIRRPDLTIKPPCWCVRCEKVVGGLQVFKKPERPTRVAYGPQYYYVCPECHTTAVPAAAPAASIIDHSTPITRIGERQRPLQPATRERIKRGLRRLATDPFAIRLRQGREPAPLTIPLVAEAAVSGSEAAPTMAFPVSGTTYETTPGNRAKDAARTPLPTVAATGERGMVMANHEHAVPKDAATHATQTVRTEGGLSPVTRTGHKSANGTLARDAGADPTLGITSAGDLALVLANRIHGVPKDARTHPAQTVCTGETLGVVELQQNGGVRRGRSAPAHTIRGGGSHHSLLVSNYSPGWVRRAGELPFGSVTTTDGHALVVPYSTKGKSSVAAREATPTVTTVERLSLVVPQQLPFGTVLPDPGPISEDEIDSCFFRMFTVPELARAMAMAFRADGSPFLLEGTRANRIKLLGNAINPPVMRLIIKRLLAAIDSTPAGGLPDAA